MAEGEVGRGVTIVLGVVAACGYPTLPTLGSNDASQSDATIDAKSDDGPRSVTPPSCLALPENCGPAGNENCCTSVVIPGGTYYRGYDASGSGDQMSPATVSDFRLDKYDVTLGRFRAFVEEGMGTQADHPTTGSGTHPNLPGSGWEASWNASLTTDTAAFKSALLCAQPFGTWDNTPGNKDENRPIDCVTWYEAMAFCIWDGGYLPTEAEWNYAASGGSDQRAYPWSVPSSSLSFDGSRASYGDGTNCFGDGNPTCSPTDIVPVGTKSAGNGKWGQADLDGNVYQWTLDWEAAYTTPCIDCATIVPGDHREARGSQYESALNQTGRRTALLPIVREDWLGVRCARSP